MSEPVTQGQTVAVSYDNLFVETGEGIFEDLYGNNLLAVHRAAGDQRVHPCRRGTSPTGGWP